MDFADNLINWLDSETTFKQPMNILICFSQPDTGKALGILANDMVRSRAEKSSITVIHFMRDEEAQRIENMNAYKNQLFSGMITASERNKVTIRTFVKISDNYVTDILLASEEQNYSLVLTGVDHTTFNPALWSKYLRLKNDPVYSEGDIHKQFEPEEMHAFTDFLALLSRNPKPTGFFVDNGFTEMRLAFAPIVDKEDVCIFPHILQIAMKEGVKVMIWDAIGIFDSNPKMQKLYQSAVKKTDGHIWLWNNDKKIESEFIQQQDLIIVGSEGWNKLISSALQWTGTLPSTLIIKNKPI